MNLKNYKDYKMTREEIKNLSKICGLEPKDFCYFLTKNCKKGLTIDESIDLITKNNTIIDIARS